MVKENKNISFNLGSGVKADTFLETAEDKERRTSVPIPVFGNISMELPPFFAVPIKGGKWRLANPLTEIRNLAKRKSNTSIKLKRANVEDPTMDYSLPQRTPELSQFSEKDQKKLIDYYKAVKEGRKDEYLFKNKPRGFPATLYKNAEKAGYKETSKKVYTKNPIKPKAPKSVKPIGRPVKTIRMFVSDYEIGDTEAVSQRKEDEQRKRLEEREKQDELDRRKEQDKKKEKKGDSDIIEDINLKYRNLWERLNGNTSNTITRKEARKQMNKIKEERPNLPDNIKEATIKEYEELSKKYKEKKEGLEGSGFDGDMSGDEYEQEDCDGQGGGGGLFDSIKGVFEKGKKLVSNVIYGRHDAYPPSAKKILDKNASAKVVSIDLHRNPLPSLYTNIMNVWTKGETEKRLKEQPKDTLFHISMWVRLNNGKTILVEKNEVIGIKEQPHKAKEEQAYFLPPITKDISFGELLEKARKEVGDKTFFSYSAKDNNCGDFIEMILKANGLNTKETHDYIGQDAQAILQGFPILRKTINSLTDIAGRANVLLEGGGILSASLNKILKKYPDYIHLKPEYKNKVKSLVSKEFDENPEPYQDEEDLVSHILYEFIDSMEGEDIWEYNTTGKGVKNDIVEYGNILKHLEEHIIDPNEKVDLRDFKQAKQIIDIIAKKKSHHSNIMSYDARKPHGGVIYRPAVIDDEYKQRQREQFKKMVEEGGVVGPRRNSGMGMPKMGTNPATYSPSSHPAMASDLFHRIPQAQAQVYNKHIGMGMCGGDLYTDAFTGGFSLGYNVIGPALFGGETPTGFASLSQNQKLVYFWDYKIKNYKKAHPDWNTTDKANFNAYINYLKAGGKEDDLPGRINKPGQFTPAGQGFSTRMDLSEISRLFGQGLSDEEDEVDSGDDFELKERIRTEMLHPITQSISTCPICDAKLSTGKNMRKHIRTKHGEEFVNEASKRGRKGKGLYGGMIGGLSPPPAVPPPPPLMEEPRGRTRERTRRRFPPAPPNTPVNTPSPPPTRQARGNGMKKPHMVKGSQEAKDYMASIRNKKGSKGKGIPSSPSRSFITDARLL